MIPFLFFVAAGAALAGALGVVLARNPVHAALFLVLTLVSVAVLFLLQDAELVAAVQVIVYASAIVVLFLFVIMLLGVGKSDDLSIEPFPIQRPLAAVVGVGLAGLLIAAVVRARDTIVIGSEPLKSDGDNNIQQLAENLFTDHVFAFEFTSILLIVAVAGTVLLSRKTKKAGDE